MTPYDPETGLRVAAGAAAPEEAAPTTDQAGWRPNPFLLALTGIWVLAALIGLFAWIDGIAVAERDGSFDPASEGTPMLLLGAVAVLTAVVAGVAHLAVLAAAWRSRRG